MSVGADPRIGTELAGYRFEGLLGRGGMSVVYLATDLRLGRKVALKLLAPELAEDARFRERFLRESRLAASLDHPSVVPIFEAGEADGLLYIAMRYVEGRDLRDVLADSGRLEPARVVAMLAQVADALDAAHERGLVHRDVKPGNVLLDAREHVYLSDFGLTREASSESGITEPGQFVGTVDYVAPEQIERQTVDGRADVYSLACVLYECLAGEAPYRSDSLTGTLWAHLSAPPPSAHERRPQLPAAIDAVIGKGMAKKPGDRYGSCVQLVQAAQAALGISGQLSVPTTPRGKRRLLLAATATAAIAAAVAIPLTVTGGRDKPAAKPPDTKPTLAITTDSIQHIDPDTNALVGTTRVNRSPDRYEGVDTTRLATGVGAVWVTYGPRGILSRLSPRTGAATGRAQTGGAGAVIEVAPGLGAVWVVNRGFFGGTLVAFDPKTLGQSAIPLTPKPGQARALGPIAVGRSVWIVATGCTPSGVLCPPDIRVWALNEGCDNLCVGQVAFSPLYVRAAAAGDGTLWLSGYLDATSGVGQLERIDEATRRYLDSVQLDFLPGDDGLAAGGGAVWLTDAVGDRLVRIDAATRRVVARIPVGHRPSAVAAGMGAVWVTNYDDGTVSRIDPSTNTVAATIEVGPRPDHIAAGEGGVWVAVHPA